MEDLSTPPLFDLQARKLDYTLSAAFLHFNDGLNVVHFVRTTIAPFQVVTHHVAEIPAAWMTDRGKYECFRAGLTIVRDSIEVRDTLAPRGKLGQRNRTSQAYKAPGPLPVPSWWVEG